MSGFVIWSWKDQNQGKYSIANIHSSKPPAVQQDTCPADHRTPRSGGKHEVSILQLLLCLWASLCSRKDANQGSQNVLQELLQCWKHHCPGIKHLVQVLMSYLSDWTRHRHDSESDLKPELRFIQKSSSEHTGTKVCYVVSKSAWAALMWLQESRDGGRGAWPCTPGRGMRSHSLPSL